jgi:hypothetical protein
VLPPLSEWSGCKGFFEARSGENKNNIREKRKMGSETESQTLTENVYDRVRRHSSEEANRLIDVETEGRVQRAAAQGIEGINRRLAELDREWDMERVLQANASTLSLVGSALAATHSKKWAILPGVVFSFFMQHAVQGWCPPVPVFRRLGIRTRQEIERERYALKVLRGDFDATFSDDGAVDSNASSGGTNTKDVS